ncbi:MAG: ribosome biogenesis GTPase Der [Marinagarivorans sp.]|nr:ribosome biogenesis GTPase Der [Marinagarivorans sp.]
MIPVIALVGRPNVGKSTLFNRITKTRDALVADLSGLTRDRKYGEATFDERRFMVVDTGGLSGEEEGIDVAMAEQSMLAIEEADLVLFMVDCRAGVMPADIKIANSLRQRSKSVMVVANKIDGLNHDVVTAAFFELGLGEVYGVAAAHGRGVSHLLGDALERLPVAEEEAPLEGMSARGIKIAVVGRPNVGKSTLVNRMLGEDRVVVFDLPGTTRDSIYIDYERFGKNYTLIDTAGIRRRKNVSLTVEKFSIVKTLQAISDANVVILMIDAAEGLVDQDLHLMGQVIDAGRALVVAFNKWDGLEQEHKTYVKSELERKLRFVDFADIHFISALHGTGVGHLYDSVENAFKAATDKLSTHYLTRILESAIQTHQPPMVNGRRIKLRYAHPGGANPPIIVIHGNQTEALPDHYKKFLEKTFRRALDLHGTPVRIQFKSTENPYDNKEKKKPATANRRSMEKRQHIDEKRKLTRHTKKK